MASHSTWHLSSNMIPTHVSKSPPHYLDAIPDITILADTCFGLTCTLETTDHILLHLHSHMCHSAIHQPFLVLSVFTCFSLSIYTYYVRTHEYMHATISMCTCQLYPNHFFHHPLLSIPCHQTFVPIHMPPLLVIRLLSFHPDVIGPISYAVLHSILILFALAEQLIMTNDIRGT